MIKNNTLAPMFTLNCKGRLLAIDQPLVMGIINITPDSFYSGSRHQQAGDILRTVEAMLSAGAGIIDIGGQSTRPGSNWLDADEEISRVVGPIRQIAASFPEAFLSIDTFHARTAEAAVAAGASLVNDISGGQLDPLMLHTVASLGVPYICMHTKGSPQTMQQEACYDDVVLDVLDYFIARMDACTKAGIHDVILDPGFGFAKNATHNIALLKNLHVFTQLNRPVLAGLSRKSTIYKTLGVTAEEALNGTTVMNTIALQNGASILRVHDVKEAVEAVKLVRVLIQK